MTTTAMLDTETQAVHSTESLISNKRLWAGRGLPTLFLLLDGSMKLYKSRPVVEATVQMGYPESAIVGLGVASSSACCFTCFLALPSSVRFC